MQAEIDDLLHAGRIQHRDHRRIEYMFRLVRQRGGLAGVVVTGDQQHAAVFGCAGRIGVLEHVAGTIDAWPLAIPDAEHAVVFGAGKQTDLLRSPHGGRSQFFIYAGRKKDVLILQKFFRLPQRLIVTTERRSTIAGNESRRVQAGGEIALALDHRQAHQCLRAGQVNTTMVQQVFVIKGDGGIRRHDCAGGGA